MGVTDAVVVDTCSSSAATTIVIDTHLSTAFATVAVALSLCSFLRGVVCRDLSFWSFRRLGGPS